MAKYTIELRHVCDIYTRETVENWFKDYNIEDYLLPSQLEIFNNSTIWSKDKLASKIVDHYFMREIAFETPALFKHYAKITMSEIMESKLPLIYTTMLEYDPLINVDYTETFTRNAQAEATAQNAGTSNSSSDSNSSSLNIGSDTPQGQIKKDEILNGKYATSTSANESNTNINDITNTNSNAKTNNSTLENYTRNFKGNQGISATYQAMIKQFRENIIAVDSDIIYDLHDLFMSIY